MKNWTKKQVLDWFGDRGIPLSSKDLAAWKWEEGKLFFIIKSDVRSIHYSDTDNGKVDVTETHQEDGSPVLCYELFDSIPIESSPLRAS